MENITKTLEYLIQKFEHIDSTGFKIYYHKIALPAECKEADKAKIWMELYGSDKSTVYTEYTQYRLFEHEEDIEPSHIVYGILRGTNVTEGWWAVRDPIQDAVKWLLLHYYESGDMPDSDTFLKNFPKYASIKEPIQQQAGGPYLWYEFLLKLSREHGALIDGDLYLSEDCLKELLPCVSRTQKLKTDVLTASKNALRYLLDKDKAKVEKPTEIDERSKPAKKLPKEPPGQTNNIKAQKRGQGVLEDHVKKALKDHPRDSLPKIVKIINERHRDSYLPTSDRPVKKTESWKNRKKKKQKQ